MTKQSFKKYTATTMAAATAATAIVPVVASAETAGFPDVSDNNDHKGNIMKLVERDVIKGYQNGDFGPYDPITRGQVAVMLKNALELNVPEDIDKALENYSDVKSGDRYAEEIAAVTAAGIFKGKDGEFKRYDNISRQQIATALVEGFNLEDYDNGEKVEVDFKDVSEDHQKNVQIIANLGITSQAKDYQGYKDVTRAQFSTFLVETLELENPAVGALEEAEKAVADFEANVDSAEKAEELVTNRDKRNEVTASYVPAANAIQKLGTGEDKEELQSRLDSANDVVIAAGSVSGLQNKVRELTEDNIENTKFEVTKTQNLINHIENGEVKDALTALVEAEQEKISDFEFNIGEISEVSVADIDEPINADEETSLTFTVTTDNGQSKDFTKADFEKTFTDYTVKFYYSVDKTTLGDKADSGIVKPAKEVKEFKYQVQVFNPYKEEVTERSNGVTVKVQDKEELAKTITEITKVELQDETGNKVDSVRPDKTVKVVATKGKNALGEVVDLKGELEPTIENAEFESNKFGEVSKSDGTIRLLNADSNVGKTQTLTVKYEDIDEPSEIDITVAEKGVADELVTSSIKSVTDKEVDLTEGVKVLNQYGEELDNPEVNVVNITGENVPETKDTVSFSEAGEYTIYYKAEGLRGTAKTTIIAAPENNDWEKDFNFELNGENKVIDVNGEDGPTTLTFTASALYDGADVTHLVPDDVRLEAESSDEDVATVASEDSEVESADITVTAVGEGTTTITVTPKQGDMPGQPVSIDVTVVDTTIQLDENSFEWKVDELPGGTVLNSENLADYLTIKDVDGEEVDIEELSGLKIEKANDKLYFVGFDKKHGVDENGQALETFLEW